MNSTVGALFKGSWCLTINAKPRVDTVLPNCNVYVDSSEKDDSFAAEAILGSAFDSSPDAIAVVDTLGRTRYANQVFRQLVDLHPYKKESYVDSLPQVPALGGLKELFVQAVKCKKDADAERFLSSEIRSFSTGQAYHSFIGYLDSKAMRVSDVSLLLLIIRESLALSNERAAVFQTKYHLTMTETRVLKLFGSGADLNRIAHELGVTIHTARAHMKSVLSKTGSRSQAHLARMFETTATGRLRISV